MADNQYITYLQEPIPAFEPESFDACTRQQAMPRTKVEDHDTIDDALDRWLGLAEGMERRHVCIEDTHGAGKALVCRWTDGGLGFDYGTHPAEETITEPAEALPHIRMRLAGPEDAS